MADAKPDPPATAQPTTTASSSNLSFSNGRPKLRNRLSRKSSNLQSPQPSRLRRRSSILSYTGLEDASSSFHEDIINPTSARRLADVEDEITHWSSTPLAFAILPALAGLLFTNGSAFVTDALLLGLAAVFMNWSIRVPREWYFSAQAIRRDVEPGSTPSSPLLEVDESALEESDGSLKPPPPPKVNDEELQDTEARDAASEQLRRQESLALMATFVFPILAAYMLHVIRSQLSQPSTSLVSDYNLAIFLLAAEFWPARQVIRLVESRTIHLQRVVSGQDDPFSDFLTGSQKNADLESRLGDLEVKVGGQPLASDSNLLPQHADLANLDVSIQKRLEPRLDSLERAVRRYEKRYTTLAMVTEQRIQSLETRLQDALSLAAVAAQHSQQRSSLVSAILVTATNLVVLPLKIAWELVIWPFKVLEDILGKLSALLFGSASVSMQGKRRLRTARQEAALRDEKLMREKISRKPVR